MKFAECEKWLWERIDAGMPISGVEFNDIEDVQLPSRLPRNCVAWPPGWIESEKRYWRMLMEITGSYMPYDDIDQEDAHIPFRQWATRYLEGRAKIKKRAWRRQIVRWLVGMDG